MRTHLHSRPLLWSMLVLGATAMGRLEAVDFIRGDANSDGAVTISDVQYLQGYLFLGSTRPECPSTGDIDDNGQIDISDSIGILHFIFRGGIAPMSPFPSVGPDPTEDGEWMACTSYGNGSPLEDPAARMEIRSAVAPGGKNRRAVVTVALSHSRPIAGYSLTIVDGAGVTEDGGIARLSGWRDLTGTFNENSFVAGTIRGHRIQLGFLSTLVSDQPTEIPAAQDAPAVEVLVCLKSGTAAGEYPLTLEAGELIGSCLPPDWNHGNPPCPDTGRSIHPALVGGTLVVEADVQGDGTCDRSVPTPPAMIHILFKMNDAAGTPGATVTVPFIVKADRPSTGFSYSVDFDEGVLQASSTRRLWDKPGGTPYEFEKFEFNNSTGYLVGAAVISLTDTGDVLPPREEVEVLEFDLRISPSAAAGTTELAFRDGGRGSGGPVGNKLIAGGVDITPSLASSFVFVNARVNIVPDVTTFLFIRGDANGDGAVDISDPTGTLGYLYLGGAPPACFDAADSNDDGKLDIADPIMTLHVLFLSGGSLPPPSIAAGVDPTPDGLSCSYLGP